MIAGRCGSRRRRSLQERIRTLKLRSQDADRNGSNSTSCGPTRRPMSEAPLGDRIPLSWIVPPGPPKNSLACSRWEIAQRPRRAWGQPAFSHEPRRTADFAGRSHGIERRRIRSGPCSAGPRGRRRLPQTLGAAPACDLHARAVAPEAALHILVRRESLKDAFSNLPEAGKIVIVPDPVALPQPLDRQQRDALRVRLGIGADRIALFFFGQLASRKGILELLLAL